MHIPKPSPKDSYFVDEGWGLRVATFLKYILEASDAGESYFKK